MVRENLKGSKFLQKIRSLFGSCQESCYRNHGQQYIIKIIGWPTTKICNVTCIFVVTDNNDLEKTCDR